MTFEDLPPTGTCELSTVGRRSGHSRRVEIWYVVIGQRLVVTGTPGARHWLANLRAEPRAVLHLRDPQRDLPVTANEITDEDARRQVAVEAWRLQPWYSEQPYTLDDWVAASPMLTLTPRAPSPGGR
jgi:deazaflavin-dependent oxidoreductase (nitroreductase family)